MKSIFAEKEYRESQGKRAAIRATPKMLVVEAVSGRGITSPDPEAFHAFLPVEADDALIGSAVLQALAASRFLSIEEAAKFKGAEGDARWNDWVSKMLHAAGLRSENTLIKSMALCHVSMKDGMVSLSPMARRRGAAWEGLGPEQRVEVPLAEGPLSIATAVRRPSCAAALG